MTRQPAKELPPDVVPGQRWRAPDGQHYEVADVHNDRATLYRCTPAGRVLNARFQTHESVERMQAQWHVVAGG
jgi:hypothetical protein